MSRICSNTCIVIGNDFQLNLVWNANIEINPIKIIFIHNVVSEVMTDLSPLVSRIDLQIQKIPSFAWNFRQVTFYFILINCEDLTTFEIYPHPNRSMITGYFKNKLEIKVPRFKWFNFPKLPLTFKFLNCFYKRTYFNLIILFIKNCTEWIYFVNRIFCLRFW